MSRSAGPSTLQAPLAAAIAPFTILVVDRNDYIRDSFVSYLSNYHSHTLASLVPEKGPTREQISAPLRLLGAREANEAIERMQTAQASAHPVGMVIVDLHLASEQGYALLEWVKAECPEAQVVLTTAYQVEEDIGQFKRLGVQTVLTKTVPFRFEELSVIIDNLQYPHRAFGLERYLGHGFEGQELTLACSDDIMNAFMTLQGFFINHNIPNLHDLCTALIEAITNAVYHAVAGPDGKDKYIKGQEIARLLPNETVSIRYGLSEQGMGVSITDQGGRLNTEQVLYWLERNMSGDNLLDTHGRGIFLIYTLCDRLVINVVPGQKTELLMLNFAGPPSRYVNKPLFIHEQPPVTGLSVD
jgi:CheY-like chemotaxis protein